MFHERINNLWKLKKKKIIATQYSRRYCLIHPLHANLLAVFTLSETTLSGQLLGPSANGVESGCLGPRVLMTLYSLWHFTLAQHILLCPLCFPSLSLKAAFFFNHPVNKYLFNSYYMPGAVLLQKTLQSLYPPEAYILVGLIHSKKENTWITF